MEEGGIHPSIHSFIHSSQGWGTYKPYKRPYKPKPSLASVPYLQFLKPPKEKEGHSEQPEGPIFQCEKICLHQRTPPRPPPPPATSFRVRRARHRAQGSIVYSLSNGLSPPHPPVSPPPPQTVHPTPCVTSQLTLSHLYSSSPPPKGNLK
jgi:hypothetical protein